MPSVSHSSKERDREWSEWVVVSSSRRKTEMMTRGHSASLPLYFICDNGINFFFGIKQKEKKKKSEHISDAHPFAYLVVSKRNENNEGTFLVVTIVLHL